MQNHRIDIDWAHELFFQKNVTEGKSLVLFLLIVLSTLSKFLAVDQFNGFKIFDNLAVFLALSDLSSFDPADFRVNLFDCKNETKLP